MLRNIFREELKSGKGKDIFKQLETGAKIVGGGAVLGAGLHKFLTKSVLGQKILGKMGINYNTIQNPKGIVQNAARLIYDATTPAQEPFLQSIFHKLKNSSPMIAAETVARFLPLVGIAAGGAGINELYNRYQHGKTYDKMFEIYPELKDADPDRVQRSFSMLKNYAPTVSKDPIGAGGVIRNLVELPDALDTSMIQNLVNLEKSAPSMSKTLMDSLTKQTAGKVVGYGLGEHMPADDK